MNKMNIILNLIVASALFFAASQSATASVSNGNKPEAKRPNILIAISDDQSWIHSSVEGSPFVQTPNLQAIADGGFYFENAYAASPGCSPSRAALLTGQHHWMIGPAGTHGSSFPAHYTTITDRLEETGYKVGFTGKGWGPGMWDQGGRDKNPAGHEYNKILLEEKPIKGISNKDYVGNFDQFMSERKEGEPFFFWYGGHEPHLSYAEGEHREAELKKVVVPAYLPDSKVSRSTLLDYAYEINHFDDHLGKIVASLKAAGELENTLIIVTSDNGMPMPRTKATGYEYGVHVPLAVHWGKDLAKGKVINEPVGFVDISATIMEVASGKVPEDIVGESLLGLLEGKVKSLDDDRAVYSGRERQTAARYQNMSFPQRMMRRGDYLVIWSMKPERDPAGQPTELIDGKLAEPHSAYYDIGPSLIKKELIAKREDPYFAPFYHLAVDKRPEWQLFNVEKDPANLTDLATKPEYSKLLEEYKQQLTKTMTETGDPRALGYGYVWENYPRSKGSMRYFPKPEQ